MRSVTQPLTDHDVARIAERQMRNWELARAQHPADEVRGTAEVADFICLSRDVSAGAAEIAAQLAHRLGWPVFDQEILHFMAGDDATRERIYASMDERDLSWSEEALRSMMDPAFVKNDYFHRLSHTVLLLARKGSGIFIGRGADLILPRQRGLRVRLVAPRAARVTRLAQRRGLSEAQARIELDRLEQERSRFMRQYFGPKADDPGRYDLVINLARIAPSQAAELILETRRLITARTT